MSSGTLGTVQGQRLLCSRSHLPSIGASRSGGGVGSTT